MSARTRSDAWRRTASGNRNPSTRDDNDFFPFVEHPFQLGQLLFFRLMDVVSRQIQRLRDPGLGPVADAPPLGRASVGRFWGRRGRDG
jgi:hypothetical protein